MRFAIAGGRWARFDAAEQNFIAQRSDYDDSLVVDRIAFNDVFLAHADEFSGQTDPDGVSYHAKRSDPISPSTRRLASKSANHLKRTGRYVCLGRPWNESPRPR